LCVGKQTNLVLINIIQQFIENIISLKCSFYGGYSKNDVSDDKWGWLD